jgi:hypothetical protein
MLFKDEAQTALFQDPVPAAFHFGYKNHSIYVIWVKSSCLFSDKYKTHKYMRKRL